MRLFKEKIKQAISIQYPDDAIEFSTIPDIDMGHLAIPCFKLAASKRRPPFEVAKELGEFMETLPYIKSTRVKGGFLNCFIEQEELFSLVIGDVMDKGACYGSNQEGIGKKALIEHTSINPNASPHIGRARNAMIGDSVVRLLRFAGYETEVHYFVNDIGKQIAMLMLGVEDIDTVEFKELLQLYIDVNEKIEKDPGIGEDVFELLNKLESGDEEVKEQFRKLVTICIKGQTDILNELGIHYDCFDYESDYLFDDTLNQVMDKFLQSGKLEEDEEGRMVMNQSDYELPMRSPYLVLTRKDKTSLYPLRDIAYTMDKMSSGADRNIIILGEDQKLYHQQITAALDTVGYDAPEVIHYAFVLLAEGKMATRKGTVVLLEDFMEEAYEKAYMEIVSRKGRAEVSDAKSIAYGAVKYAILKNSNDKNVTFDLDEALSFKGDSGPYLQYSLARIHSIEKKVKDVLGDLTVDQTDAFDLLGEKEELALIIEVANMYEMLEQALVSMSPHIVAVYLYNLTQKFSEFYHHHSVLHAESQELMIQRGRLIGAVKQVMINCFGLLGIDVLEAM